MRNLTLKIACVVVAILVWIQVASTTMVEADVSLPMEIVGLGEGWTVDGSALPEEGRARLRVAKLSLLAHQYVGWQLGTVQVNLANYRPGPPELYVIKESDVRTEAEVVTLLPPIRLPLRIDWRDEHRLPVQVPLRGQLPGDRMLAGPVSVDPDSVLVTGPRRYFQGVERVETETVELDDLDQSVDRELDLVPLPQPLEAARRSVRVEIPVTPIDERVVANVPVVTTDGGDGRVTGISPPVCDILVRGPADRVAALSPTELAVTIPVDGLEPGVHRLVGEVTHPDWVIAVRVEPEAFMVIVDRPGGVEAER
ncbi:hypothetical protein GF314_15845 [bacterium]|nr:hypothetical protein [bacterium]